MAWLGLAQAPAVVAVAMALAATILSTPPPGPETFSNIPPTLSGTCAPNPVP
jgi:hypothetical protein